MASAIAAGMAKCSTPYGIKGLGSICLDDIETIPVVLKALRHLRFGQYMPFSKKIPYEVCSTPYGIKGLGSQTYLESSIHSARAQRLTASKVWAGS